MYRSPVLPPAEATASLRWATKQPTSKSQPRFCSPSATDCPKMPVAGTTAIGPNIIGRRLISPAYSTSSSNRRSFASLARSVSARMAFASRNPQSIAFSSASRAAFLRLSKYASEQARL